jgi:hypothetical protein
MNTLVLLQLQTSIKNKLQFIVRNITHLVLNNPEYHVNDVIAKIQKFWKTSCSYKKFKKHEKWLCIQ